MKIEELISLADFLQDFSNIKRSVRIKDHPDLENDAEHSYILAISSWYIAEKLHLEVNKERLFEYALAHDLVEVYAGDTDPNNSSIEHIASKSEREKAALVKIQNRFPDFHSLHKAIENYEELKDTESQVVYLTDKILPVINTYLSKDSYYRDSGVSFEKWKSWIESKMDVAKLNQPGFVDLIQQLSDFLEKKRGMFNSG
ncbi:MAG: HD domain-containing protein [Candidatus Paceibacterota bacterium]